MKNLIFFIRWLIGCKKLRFLSPAALCCMLLSLSFSGFADDDPILLKIYTFTEAYELSSSNYFSVSYLEGFSGQWVKSCSGEPTSQFPTTVYVSYYTSAGEPTVKYCPNLSSCNITTCSMCGKTYCANASGSHPNLGNHVCSGSSTGDSGSGSSTGDSGSGSSTGDSGSGSSTGDSSSGSSTETESASTSTNSDLSAIKSSLSNLLSKVSTEAKQDNILSGLSNWSSAWKTNSQSILTQLQNNQQTMGQIYTNLHADNENTNNKLDDLKDKSDTANNYLSGLNSKADIRNQGISDLKDGVGNIKDGIDTIRGINDNIRSGVTNVDGTVKELMDKVDPSTANPVTLKENLTSDKLKNKSNALDSIKKKIMPPDSFYNVSSSSSFWDKTITLNLSSFGVDDMDLSIKGGYYYRNSVLSNLATFTRALSTVVFAFFFVRGIITALRQW